MRLVMDLQACQIFREGSRDIGRYSMAWAKAVLQRAVNHDVHVVLNGAFAETIEVIRHDLSAYISGDRVHVFGAPHHVSARAPSNTWQRRAAEVMRSAALRELQPDFVHLCDLFGGLDEDAVTSIGESRFSPPSSVTLHDLGWYDGFAGREAGAAVDAWRGEKIASLQRADLVFATSDEVKHAAVERLHLPASRVMNISLAATPPFHRREPDQGAKEHLLFQLGISRSFILTAGDADHRERLENVICAYAMLPVASRQAHQLVIAGNVREKDRSALHRIVAKAGLREDEVVIAAHLEDESLAVLCNICRLFVYPYSQTGFLLPVIEAFACGAPVIAAKTPAIATPIVPRDALFDEKGGQSLAVVMQRALTDEGFRQELISHGEKWSQRFSWSETARCVLDAMEASVVSRALLAAAPTASTPRRRLALVSPMRSGAETVDASELLLPLAENYDVDLIGDEGGAVGALASDRWNYRSLEWFRVHASTYDRVVYHFHDQRLYATMLTLLKEIPGTVVLGEFHFGALLHQLESNGEDPDMWWQSLYDSHGYPALVDYKNNKAIAEFYPCNWQTLANADGVIVRYHHWQDLIERWYGAQLACRVRVLPFREPPSPRGPQKQRARHRLGLPLETFVFVSPGDDGASAAVDLLLTAWRLSGLAEGGIATLVLTENTFEPVSADELTKESGSALIQYATMTSAQYSDLLDAADVVVWLGEGSCGLLRDGLLRGIPAVVRRGDAPEELPREGVWALSEDCDERSIADALVGVCREPCHIRELAQAAAHYMDQHAVPASTPTAYQHAIESFAFSSPRRKLGQLAQEIANATADMPAEDIQRVRAARGMAEVYPLGGEQSKLLVDVSTLVGTDAKSGVQRVVRSVLTQLLKGSLGGLRVEPIYADPQGAYRYARHFTCEFLGLRLAPDVDAEVEMSAGDTFLGLDLCAHLIPDRIHHFRLMRERGVSIQFVVYDLLPSLHPDWFPADLTGHLERWYRSIAEVSDRVIAISRSVAAEYLDWLDENQPVRSGPLQIGYFHLGADIETNALAGGVDPAMARSIEALAGRPVVLMVGTVEPRKGHEVALDAFEELWSQGSDAVLVIVGKRGWRVDSLAARLLRHAELGRRLHWFQGASDEALELIYRHSALLLAASFGEGFGLPLIEAAHRGLPLLARDIPVFREVAGNGAIYFREDSACSLASTVSSALQAWRRGDLPDPVEVGVLDWSQSTADLCKALHGRCDLYTWQPAHPPHSLSTYPALKVKRNQ